MSRTLNAAIFVAGVLGCCAAAIQISQLVDGRAAPEIFNYAVTGATALAGLGFMAAGWWQRRSSARVAPVTDQTLVAALDVLFAHFPDDPNAQEAVRVVARAVTERRYGKKVEG